MLHLRLKITLKRVIRMIQRSIRIVLAKRLKYSSIYFSIFIIGLLLVPLSSWLFFNFYITWKPHLLLKFLGIAAVVISPIHYLYNTHNSNSMATTRLKSWLPALVVVTLLAFGERLYKLGEASLFHDEFWIASSARSFYSTRETTLWDFINSVPSEVQYQLILLSTLVGSITLFLGYNEFSLRLIPALAGCLAVLAVFVLTTKLTRSYVAAFLAFVALAFSETSIYLSRYLRQYSLLQLLSLILCIYILKSADSKQSIRTLGVILIASVLLWGLTVSQVSPFALSFTPFLLIPLASFYLALKNTNRYMSFLFVILLLIAFFTYSVLMLVDEVPINFINLLDRNFIPGLDYYRSMDYFNWVFGDSNLPPWLLFSFSLIGTFLLVKEFGSKGLILATFFWLPLGFLLINLYHSHDLRYTNHLLPFLYITVSYFIAFILQKLKLHSYLLVITTISVAALIFGINIPGGAFSPYIGTPYYEFNFEQLSQIHRRAVPPDYKTVYSKLNDLQSAGDSVILIDGYQYLSPKDEVNYYTFIARDSVLLINSRNKTPVSFSNILETSNTVYLVGAYIHLYDNDSTQFILRHCNNIAISLGVSHFNYNGFYVNNNETTWPSLYRCDLE